MTFQNPDDRALFVERKLTPIGKTHLVAGSGIDLNLFHPTPFPDTPHFLLKARLIAEKGIREYVAAAQIVKQEFPRAVFTLAGYHVYHLAGIPQQEREEWEKAGFVDFVGQVEDVRPLIAKSSVYVLPSYREGLPRTVLEAMAMGRAIITTEAPGCRETVQPGINGFLVPVRQVEPLVEAMREFCRNPELVPTMGLASREMAVDRFDVKKVNAEIMQIMGL